MQKDGYWGGKTGKFRVWSLTASNIPEVNSGMIDERDLIINTIIFSTYIPKQKKAQTSLYPSEPFKCSK
jgi:hypothetical protein